MIGFKLIRDRTRVDVASLQQSREAGQLNEGIQAVLDRMDKLGETVQQNFIESEASTMAITDAINETTTTVITAVAHVQSASATEHAQTRRDLASLDVTVLSAIAESSSQSRQYHLETNAEIERIREEAQVQVDSLHEEIRLLKIEIQESIQEIVASVGKVNAREEQRLKELGNAKFNLWVAKEIVLKKLLVGKMGLPDHTLLIRALGGSKSSKISTRRLGPGVRISLVEDTTLCENRRLYDLDGNASRVAKSTCRS